MINLVIDPRDPALVPLGPSTDGKSIRPVDVTVATSRTVRLAAGGFVLDGAKVRKQIPAGGSLTVSVPATDGTEIHADDRSTFVYVVTLEVTTTGRTRDTVTRTFRGLLPTSLGATAQVTSLVNTDPLPPVLGGGGDGVSDHGLLTGLGDDDHPHYLNNARGDARYVRTVNGTGPDGSGNVAVSGGSGGSPTGTAGGDLAGSYPNPTVVAASTTLAGKVELATNTEATTGTDTARAVTPAGVRAAGDARYLESETFTITGTAYTAVGSHRLYVESACVVDSVRASVGTAPTGASLIVDVNRNGATIYGTQANRPTIVAAANTAVGGAASNGTLAAGDYLTVDVDQVGSTAAGANLSVTVRLRRA